jgi:hypothetical protein
MHLHAYVKITPKDDAHNLLSVVKSLEPSCQLRQLSTAIMQCLRSQHIDYRRWRYLRFRAIKQLELAAAVQRVLIRKLQGKENVIIRSARL